MVSLGLDDADYCLDGDDADEPLIFPNELDDSEDEDDGGSDSEPEGVGGVGGHLLADDTGVHLNHELSELHVCDLPVDRYRQLLLHNPDLKVTFEVYMWCLDAKVKVGCYRRFRRLSVLPSNCNLPQGLQTLRNNVYETLKSLLGGDIVKTIDIGYPWQELFPTPYINVLDAFSIWFSVPSIVSTVRKSNFRYLPRNLVDVGEFNALIARREVLVHADNYVYESVEDGSLYLPNIRDAIPLYKDAYIHAVHDGIEVILITLGMYEDTFSKNINSAVVQTIFTLTLCKLIHPARLVQRKMLILISFSRGRHW